MEKKNSIFIATSLDGFISDRNGGIDWLHSIPNPEQNDLGYEAFISTVDALVMGRITFETVCAFDIDWPYKKPVFVLSRSMRGIPSAYKDKAYLLQGPLSAILGQIHDKGHFRLYVDGGTTIQCFLRENFIDEMIITTIPILLGGGSSLFGHLDTEIGFRLVGSKVYLDAMVQSHYVRSLPEEI